MCQYHWDSRYTQSRYICAHMPQCMYFFNSNRRNDTLNMYITYMYIYYHICMWSQGTVLAIKAIWSGLIPVDGCGVVGAEGKEARGDTDGGVLFAVMAAAGSLNGGNGISLHGTKLRKTYAADHTCFKHIYSKSWSKTKQNWNGDKEQLG